MKVFQGQKCGQMMDFANTRYERCGHRLGYLPDLAVLSALAPLEGDRWRPLAAPTRLSRFCANAAHDACNWLVPAKNPRFWSIVTRNRTCPRTLAAQVR